MTILNVFKHPRRFAASAVLGVSFLAVGPTVLLSGAAQAATVSPAHVGQQAVSKPPHARRQPRRRPRRTRLARAGASTTTRLRPPDARAEPDVHVHASPTPSRPRRRPAPRPRPRRRLCPPRRILPTQPWRDRPPRAGPAPVAVAASTAAAMCRWRPVVERPRWPQRGSASSRSSAGARPGCPRPDAQTRRPGHAPRPADRHAGRLWLRPGAGSGELTGARTGPSP